MAGEGANDGHSTNNSNGNSLIVYHNYHSFYSQKVVMALIEKRLKFRSRMVQLASFEQYEPWFMRLNPLGEVPVLKDGVKIIPDSARIIDYLEDNFSNGDTPRLQPERGSSLAQKVKHFRELVDSVPIEDLTMGCLKYPQMTLDMKIPQLFQNKMKALNIQRLEVLRENAEKHAELKEHYEEKLKIVQERKAIVEKKETLEHILQLVSGFMDEVENELASHAELNWWLCCERLTVADISMAILLHRLFLLGLSTQFWGLGQRPHLAKYHRRIIKLDSFRLACLTVPTYDKVLYTVELLKEKAPLLISAAALLTAIAVGIVWYKRYK